MEEVIFRYSQYSVIHNYSPILARGIRSHMIFSSTFVLYNYSLADWLRKHQPIQVPQSNKMPELSAMEHAIILIFIKQMNIYEQELDHKEPR